MCQLLAARFCVPVVFALLLSLPCAAAAAPPLGNDAQQYAVAHIQLQPRTVRERAPQPGADVRRELARSDYDRPRDIAARLHRLRPRTLADRGVSGAACDPGVFASATGGALVGAVRRSTSRASTSCTASPAPPRRRRSPKAAW